ncbi:hypothetical protein RUND412_005637 [Rhizina undulata]
MKTGDTANRTPDHLYAVNYEELNAKEDWIVGLGGSRRAQCSQQSSPVGLSTMDQTDWCES